MFHFVSLFVSYLLCMQAAIIDERLYLDPVFLNLGVEVYTNEYANLLRNENLDLKRKGQRIWNIVPQQGFQDKRGGLDYMRRKSRQRKDGG